MKNKNHITILGCGSSSGVPTIENGWGKCDPNNIKNQRTRSSILVHLNGYNILIDTSPDLRYQALKNNITHLDCVLYTHEHSDHIVGIDEVRSFNRLAKKPIDCYLSKKTFNKISSLFNYVYENPEELNIKGYYRACLIPHIIKTNDIITLNKNKITIKAIEHSHGSTTVLGYKFNNKFAYITDILNFLNKASLEEYKNLDFIIISACVLHPHKSHMAFHDILDMLTNHLQPKKAYLTHMSEEIDFEIASNSIKNKNINNIFLCYDSLKIYF